MPPLVEGATLRARPQALLFRHTGFPVGDREDKIGRPSKDLGFSEPEQTLSTNIPGGYQALGIRSENGEVAAAVDDKLQQLLLLRQLLLHLAAHWHSRLAGVFSLPNRPGGVLPNRGSSPPTRTACMSRLS